MAGDGRGDLVDGPTRAVIDREDGDRTGLLEGRLSIDGGRLGLTVADGTVGCALGAIDRVIVDGLPPALERRFGDGLAVQWQGEGGWRRAFFELSGDDKRRFLEELPAAAIGTPTVVVEQTVAPHGPDAGGDSQRWHTETTLQVDTGASAVNFDARELEPIRPSSVTSTTLTRADVDGETRPCVRVAAVSSTDRIESQVYCSSEARAKLLRDYVVGIQDVTGTGGPISVLLVDDEPSLVELAKMHLQDEHEGLSVRFATHTQHAIALVEEENFDCIITDYSMPEGGAPEILRAARERDSSVPFIVFSRKDPRKIPDSEKPAGVDRWIEKEMGSDQYDRLALTIQRFVARRRAGEPIE